MSLQLNRADVALAKPSLKAASACWRIVVVASSELKVQRTSMECSSTDWHEEFCSLMADHT